MMTTKNAQRDLKLRKRAVAIYLAPTIVGTILVAFLNYPYSWYVGFGLALVFGFVAQKFLIAHGIGMVLLGTATAVVSSQFTLKSLYVLLPAQEISSSTNLSEGLSTFRPLYVKGLKISDSDVRTYTEEISYPSLFNIVYGRQPGESLKSYMDRRWQRHVKFERKLQMAQLRESNPISSFFNDTGIYAACICEDSWSKFETDGFYLVQNPDSLIAFATLIDRVSLQKVMNPVFGEPYSTLIWTRILAILLGFGLPIYTAYFLFKNGTFKPPGRD